MTTREELKSFLVTDIPTQITASTIVAYPGQIDIKNQYPLAARVQYLYREKLRNDTGYVRHHVIVHVISQGRDAHGEATLTSDVAEVTDEMVDDYNGQVSVFAAGLSSRTIVRAKARREETIQARTQRKNLRRTAVKIEIDEFEA